MKPTIKTATIIPTADRTATFIASTSTEDRYGDIVEATGWDLENFQKNPVLLFGHKSRDLPIGKVTSIRVEGERLIADTAGLDSGVDSFADKVWNLIKNGFLNAVSVGFMPLEYESRYDQKGHYQGTRYTKQDLLELSVVPTPANQEALAVARSMGANPNELSTLFTAAPGYHDGKRRELEIIKLKNNAPVM